MVTLPVWAQPLGQPAAKAPRVQRKLWVDLRELARDPEDDDETTRLVKRALHKPLEGGRAGIGPR